MESVTPKQEQKTFSGEKNEGISEIPVPIVSGGRAYLFIKRSFDILTALIAGIVCLIPMGIIAILIKADSPGPALFKQERLGKNGKPFTIFKFRSMRTDAEAAGPQWAEENDDRCTRIGRFIRSTRLDELPQLWNIFIGDMSLVGPRPERAYFYNEFEKYIPGFRSRMLVKPGLTGLAQVNGGYDLKPEEKIVYDIKYIETRSVGLDLHCMFKTVSLVFTHEGGEMMSKVTPKAAAALVSVVMPAYNAEKTIEPAIRSVLDQTHGELELIVVEDCGDDGTLEIVGRCAQEDPRVRVLKNEKNLGVSLSRNRGVQAARGEWIALIDSDDMWVPEKLQKQLAHIRNYSESSICFTGSKFIDEDGGKYGYTLGVPERITYRELLKQNLISCSSVLVRRDVLKNHPMHDDPMIHEDFAVWLKILEKEPFAVGINEPLLIYRISKNSKSGNKINAAKMQWRTYRHVRLGLWQSACNFCVYAARNLRKYQAIRQSADQ